MKLKMKYAALCAALVVSAGLLSACGGSDSGSSAPPAAGSSAASVSQPASSSQANSVAAPAPAVGDAEISYGGVVLAPNGDMAPVLEALGDPVNYSEVISCMFEGGMDKTYEYDGVTIYTYPTDTQELILLIDITSPELVTSRGVKVGDELDGALLAYDDVIVPESDTRYTATFGDVFFTIMAEGGLVTNMSYELDATPIF